MAAVAAKPSESAVYSAQELASFARQIKGKIQQYIPSSKIIGPAAASDPAFSSRCAISLKGDSQLFKLIEKRVLLSNLASDLLTSDGAAELVSGAKKCAKMRCTIQIGLSPTSDGCPGMPMLYGFEIQQSESAKE